MRAAPMANNAPVITNNVSKRLKSFSQMLTQFHRLYADIITMTYAAIQRFRDSEMISNTLVESGLTECYRWKEAIVRNRK
jgi:hypothetical protein